MIRRQRGANRLRIPADSSILVPSERMLDAREQKNRDFIQGLNLIPR